MKTRLNFGLIMWKPSSFLFIVLFLLFLQPRIFATDTKPNEPGPWSSLQINTYTGNLFYQRNDLNIPTRGEIQLSIDFWYNSLMKDMDDGYGKGWSFSFGMYYTNQEDQFTVYREEGQEDVFTWDVAVEMWAPPAGVYDELTEYESGKYLLRTKYGIRYYFDDNSHKKLTGIIDRNGNTITLSYFEGKPTTITDPSGRMLNLSWAGDHLSQLTDPNTSPGRVIAFSYDENWNLVQVTRPLSNVYQYGYDVNGNMNAVTDPNGNTVTITYDANEAVAGLSCAPVNYNKTFVYDNCNNTTTVSQVVSAINRQTIYTFDLDGRVINKQFPDGNDISYTWDSQDNMITYVNEMGSTITYTYDTKGNMLSETDCRGNAEIYTYESTYNNMTSYRDKNSNFTYYGYDASGNLNLITDCFNNTEVFTYNSYGQVLIAKNKNNQTTTYTYDIYGNQTALTDPLSFSKTRTYDLAGNMLTETDKRSYTTTYTYDALDRNTLITDEMGYTRSFIYDANTNLVSETNQNGKTTTYAYDAANRLISTTDANGGTFTRAYDEASNVVSETNARGSATTSTYNSRDWLTVMTDCLGNSESYTYNAAGFMLSSTDKGGNTTNYTHNCLGQVTLQTDPNGYTDSFVYDPAGNQTSHTNKNGVQTTFIFDGLGRLTTINYPMSFSETFTYDAENNQTGFTDRNGNTTTTVYDAMGRVLSVTDPASITESRTYDGEGNVASSTDKNGKTTTYSYDPIGRLIQKTDPAPLSYTESFTWDGNSNILTSTDRRGNTTIRQYDNLDRLTILTSSLGYTETSSYDAMGNIVSFTNKNGFTSTYTYDCLDQLTVITDPLSLTETNVYNANGQRTGFTDKNGNTTTWNYSCCRLLSETDPLLFTEYYSYDNFGNRTSLTNKNGYTTTYSYDDLNRLTAVTSPMLNQTLLTLDGNGNILTKTDGNLNTITYSYNARGDLITTTYPDATSINYIYNNNGDLLQTVNTGGIGETITYTYDVLGRILSKAINYGAFTKTITYTYDQNGNTLTTTSETGTLTCVYDNDDRVTQITDQNGGVTTFQYDGMGNQTVVNYPNGTTTYTTYDANGNVISVVTQTTPPPPPPSGKPVHKSALAGMDPNRDILLDTDLAVTDILSPVSGTGLGEEPVTIVITNYGSLPVTMFEASYFIGSEVFVQLVEMFINPTESVVFTFTQFADLSEPGDYLIETCVNATGDEFTENNCMITVITNEMPLITYQQFIYNYDANGNKTVESRLDGTTTFLAYNEMNELVSEYNTASGMLNEYTYYPGGQRETISSDGIIDLYAYNMDGALMSAGDVSYTSDDNGNRTSMTIGLETTEYAFSFDNELTAVSFPDLSTAQYYYSALGEQLKKYENGLTSFSLFTGRQSLNEYDAAGSPSYVYNPGLSITGGLSTGYYYYNGDGSTTMQLDADGVVMATDNFDFFGMSAGSTGIWMNNREEFYFMLYVPVLDLYFNDGTDFNGYLVYDPFTGLNLCPDPDPANSNPQGKVEEKIDDKEVNPAPEKIEYCKGASRFFHEEAQIKYDDDLEKWRNMVIATFDANARFYCGNVNSNLLKCETQPCKKCDEKCVLKVEYTPKFKNGSVREWNPNKPGTRWPEGIPEQPLKAAIIMSAWVTCKCVCE
jgi:YD repeat-containing protein